MALTAAAALGIAGCTSGARSTIATTHRASGHASAAAAGRDAFSPVLTLADAQAAYHSYVTISDRAAATGNRLLALSVVTGVQAALVDTQFSTARDAQARPPFARYSFRTPAFYLPDPSTTGSPRYFVVSVDRTPVSASGAGASGAGASGAGASGAGASGAAAPGGVSAPDLAAGVRLPARGYVLMLFEQVAQGGPWQLASTSQLAPGQSVPKLATDSRGYVKVEPMTTVGTGQLVRPALTGPLQAAVVDDGPASAAAKVVASGPLTTGMYEAARTSARGISAPQGDVYQWLLEGSNYGRLALRTADGGALVFYAMYLNTVVSTPSVVAQAIPLVPGPPITIPDYLKPLMPPGQKPARNRLLAEDVLSFAAIDPPAPRPGATPAKIQVIAIGGGVRYASAG